MRTEYKREMNRNYMVITPEPGWDETYTGRMLTDNPIPGLLPFRERSLDGKKAYYYDITSRQPLDRILETRMIRGWELKMLFEELLNSLRQLERFFLDEGQIRLEPEFIYVEPNSFHCRFCVVPGKKGDFARDFEMLSQYLLDHVNHKDSEAVVLAFAVFRESRKLNFGIDDIEVCIRRRSDTKGSEEEKVEAEDEAAAPRISEIEYPGEREDEIHGRESEPHFLEVGACTPFSPDTGSDKKARKRWGGAAAAVMLLLPICIFFLGGTEGFLNYKWQIGAAEIFLLAAGILLSGISGQKVITKKEKEEEGEENEEGAWEVFFREEEMSDERPGKERERTGEWYEETAEEEEEMHTVLLTVRPTEREYRKLTAVNGGPEISMGYFPFLIGKSQGVVDFCLQEPGVSRLHVKIEESGDGYTLTDLNSTNGTRVNGRLLGANETCALPLGSEVEIAAKKFQFH